MQDIEGIEAFTEAYNIRIAKSYCSNCKNFLANMKFIKVGPLPPPFVYVYGWSLLERWELDEGEALEVPAEVIAGLKNA
jgi:hypothetical protein